MFLLENLAAILLWFLLAIVAVNAAFLYFIFYRRFRRNVFFMAKDAARARYLPIIDSLLEEKTNLTDATASLLTARSRAEEEAVEELALSRINPATVTRLTELLFALGLVQHWTQRVFGKKMGAQLVDSGLKKQSSVRAISKRSRLADAVRRLRIFSVPRVVALTRLSKLDASFVQPMLAAALADPSAEVRQVAVTALGHFAYDLALPQLFDELVKAIEGNNDVSLRSTRAALTGYSLPQLSRFTPWLDHQLPRVRFVVFNIAADISARAAETEVLNKNDFSVEFYNSVLQHTSDDSADVRAQSADIVKHFGDASAIQALRRLLNDENEFVRLHATRASARYIELLPELAKKLTDSRWRVRESAVKTISTFGASGMNELYRHLAITNDAYTSQQITEEIQKGGVINDLIAGLASSGTDRELALGACKKMIEMGRTTLLATALAASSSPDARVALMYALAPAKTEDVRMVMQFLAENESGVVKETAATLLRSMANDAAQAAGGTA